MIICRLLVAPAPCQCCQGLHPRPVSDLGGEGHGADAILLVWLAGPSQGCMTVPVSGSGCAGRVHDEAELDEALTLGGDLIGINNRTSTFDTTSTRPIDCWSGYRRVQVVTEVDSVPQHRSRRCGAWGTPFSSARPLCGQDPGAALAAMFSSD